MFRSKMKFVKLENINTIERKLLSGNASDAWIGVNRMIIIIII